MTGPHLGPGADPAIADAAHATLRRHLPPGVDTGRTWAVTLLDEPDDLRVALATTVGHWFTRNADTTLVRRLDSDLGEAWDIGAGRIEVTVYAHGAELSRHTQHVGVAEWDQAAAAYRDHGLPGVRAHAQRPTSLLTELHRRGITELDDAEPETLADLATAVRRARAAGLRQDGVVDLVTTAFPTLSRSQATELVDILSTKRDDPNRTTT
jgi:hypothetical protein